MDLKRALTNGQAIIIAGDLDKGLSAYQRTDIHVRIRKVKHARVFPIPHALRLTAVVFVRKKSEKVLVMQRC